MTDIETSEMGSGIGSLLGVLVKNVSCFFLNNVVKEKGRVNTVETLKRSSTLKRTHRYHDLTELEKEVVTLGE